MLRVLFSPKFISKVFRSLVRAVCSERRKILCERCESDMQKFWLDN